MAVIFHNLIFLEHPRTGSTAVRIALKSIGGKTRSRHTLVKPNKNQMVIATVRNPYDVVVSWWLNTLGKHHNMEFLEFVNDYVGNSLFTRNGLMFYFAPYVNMMLRYETLVDDLTKVLVFSQLPAVKLQHINTTSGKKPYTEYYTSEIQIIVANRWREEIERFGYEFKG